MREDLEIGIDFATGVDHTEIKSINSEHSVRMKKYDEEIKRYDDLIKQKLHELDNDMGEM